MKFSSSPVQPPIQTRRTSHATSHFDQSRHADDQRFPKQGSVLTSNAVLNCSRKLLLAVLALGAFGVSAQTKRAHGLCEASDEVVFSCDLQGSKKTVSLCASPDDGQGQGRFHYVFGSPSHIELKFSSQNADDRVFSRSRWLYAATFGQAYSFINGGYKYIVVSVEDSADQRGNSSLVVQRTGEARAAREMTCQPSTVTKTKNESVLQRINDWPVDKDIDGRGPPSTR